MTKESALYLPPLYQDSADSGRLILRDGTTATIRVAEPADAEALHLFFEQLSPESRYSRFFAFSVPPAERVAALCDPSDRHGLLTLLVERTVDGTPRIIATASYLAIDEKNVEVAFAVQDEFQGKGLGTLLLERLAVLATRSGITRFWAVTHADNRPMLGVFSGSGFHCKSHQEGTLVEIDLLLTPNQTSVARAEARDKVVAILSLRPYFQPSSEHSFRVQGLRLSLWGRGTAFSRARLRWDERTRCTTSSR